jgi:hypothetical protein
VYFPNKAAEHYGVAATGVTLSRNQHPADTPKQRYAGPVSVCLSPGSADDDGLPLRKGTTHYVPFWLEPPAAWALRSLRGLHDNSLFTLRIRNLPSPYTARLLAVLVLACRQADRLLKGSLSPEVRTRPLPVAHVRVGNCWSYSRSQHQPPVIWLLNVTRQKRALPSTTMPIYVRRTATRVAPAG